MASGVPSEVGRAVKNGRSIASTWFLLDEKLPAMRMAVGVCATADTAAAARIEAARMRFMRVSGWVSCELAMQPDVLARSAQVHLAVEGIELACRRFGGGHARTLRRGDL